LFTGAEVMRMVETGILSKNDKVELLEGDLIEMPPQGPPHAGLVGELHERLREAYGRGFAVRSQLPLDCDPHSLPEPDVAVVVGAHAQYRQRHPRGAEAVLAVEVARSSHVVDRFKATIYARAGVPVYWLIDEPARRVEVYSDPKPDGSYGLVTILKPGDTVTPPGTSALWTLDGLLPEP
jgi:Uma2 family endonuclease